MKLSRIIIGLIFVGFVKAAIENRIIGKPVVSCRKEGVSLKAEVLNPFEGQVYVRGSRNNANCWKKYDKIENQKNVGLDIDVRQLSMCGFSFLKKPGSNSSYLVSGHIVVSFHPSLVTSSDRAFSVHCEFENIAEPERQLESRALVGNLEKTPRISMSIQSQKPENKENEEFEIGQPLILKWELDEEHAHGILGMSLERCSAETSDGQGMRILENGCSLDEELISDSSTSADHNKIMASSEAFKFPEENIVFIRCYVKLCIRRLAHLTSSTTSADLCPIERDCSDRLRNRRELQNSTLIPITAKFRVKQNGNAQSLKKEEFQLCINENLYFIGLSSIVIMYILTFSTVLFMRKLS